MKVRCPFCGRILEYQPRSKNKYNWTKVCPYCNHKFKVVLKRKPSWERIIYL